jgi:hypothetical protein
MIADMSLPTTVNRGGIPSLRRLVMADMHDDVFASNNNATDGFSAGRMYGTSFSTSRTAIEHSEQLVAELDVLKELLQSAVQELTVPQFFELRRKFEAVWLDILDEL